MATLPSPPTVRQVWRLALPLGSTLVAGKLGLDRPVRWARTGGVLSPLFPELDAEEAALLDLPHVQAGHPSLALERVVRELSRLRIAAIAVRGEVDRAAQREAERCNLPLFQLPEDAEVPRAARAINRLVSDREAQQEAQAAALYRHLSQLVATGGGLAGVAGALYRLSGHAVRVRDPAGHLLARAGRAAGADSDLTMTLSVGETPVASLVLLDTGGAFDTFSQMALEQGGAAMTLELAKLEAVEAAREGVHEDFVVTLLLDEEDSIVRTRARAADYPLDVAQWAILGVVETEGVEEAELRRWSERVTVQAQRLGRHLRPHVDQTMFPPLGRVWQVALVLAGGSPDWESPHADFVEFLLASWQAARPLSLGVGEPSTGLAGLRRALLQARDTLGLGLRLFGPGRSYLHRDLGLYRLLRHVQDTEELEQFLDRTLTPLAAYDHTHGTELVTTLRHFLDHGGNVSATARAMHLHRNSLAYRLDRIRAITGLEPASPEDAFTFRLALMLAPLRQ